MPINYDVDYLNVLKLCQERGREIERLTFCYKNHLQGIAELQAKVEQLEGALYPIGKLGYDQTPRQLGMSIKALHRVRALASEPSKEGSDE